MICNHDDDMIDLRPEEERPPKRIRREDSGRSTTQPTLRLSFWLARIQTKPWSRFRIRNPSEEWLRRYQEQMRKLQITNYSRDIKVELCLLIQKH